MFDDNATVSGGAMATEDAAANQKLMKVAVKKEKSSKKNNNQLGEDGNEGSLSNEDGAELKGMISSDDAGSEVVFAEDQEYADDEDDFAAGGNQFGDDD